MDSFTPPRRKTRCSSENNLSFDIGRLTIAIASDVDPPGEASDRFDTQERAPQRQASSQTRADQHVLRLEISVARPATVPPLICDMWNDDVGPAPKTSRTRLADDWKEARALSIERVAQMAAKLQTDIDRQKDVAVKRRGRKLKTSPAFMSSPVVSENALPSSTLMSPCTPHCEEVPVIIFDWDDTLFPTWHVSEVIHPCLPSSQRYAELSSDSVFREALAQHAKLLKDALVCARDLGHVAIVTLAKRPWVVNSARWFLPGLDMDEHLDELGIPVYYAREHLALWQKRAVSVEEGVCAYTTAKRNAIRRCLKEFGYKSMRGLNLLSVGDSTIEEEAVKELMWSDDADDGICKVVKFMEEPTLELLSMELQILQSSLVRLTSYGEDLTINMDGNPNHLPRELGWAV